MDRIQIMIISRSEAKIRVAGGGKPITLTELRRRAKKAIEDTLLFKRSTFDCWIHEDEPALPAGRDAWDSCRAQVRRSHIVLMLYNGDAGASIPSATIGIGHAEAAEALGTAPARLRIIDIHKAMVSVPPANARNKRFVDYMDTQARPVGFAENDEEALRCLLEAVQDAVVYLSRIGALGLRTARYATGAPLEWSRLDYARRKKAIEGVLTQCLDDGAGNTIQEIAGTRIYMQCHAVPAAMGVASARELVGRPFLRDHAQLPQMGNGICGPVHVIGCHKSVTENQAVNLLGFPDAIIVTPEFGIYVADNIQKIQIFLLANCRDESTTRLAVAQFQAWLRSSGETDFLAERAKGRKAIVTVISDQLSRSAPGAGPR
jgi:hypothetical protein